MEIFFYCQNCDEKITSNQLSLLSEGKCPKCDSLEGFSTLPKSEQDPFTTVTVINDTELLEKTFEGKGGR